MKKLLSAFAAFLLAIVASVPLVTSTAGAAAVSQSLACGLGGTQTETVTGTAPATVAQGSQYTVDLAVAQATAAGGAIKNLVWYFQAPTGSSIVAGSATTVGTGSGALGTVSTLISGSLVELKVSGEIPNGGVFQPPVLEFKLQANGAVGTTLPISVQTSQAYSLTALGTINISCTANNPIAVFTTSTIIGVPGAPTIGSATAGNAQASLNWTAPGSTGGSAITGYVVTPYIGAVAQAAQTFNSTATSQAITGLTNGTAYTFKVAAVNAAGTGAQSAASNTVTPVAPAGVPDAPTGAAAVGGNSQATVSWSAPAFDGGSPLTGYVVTPYIGASAQPAQTFNSTATTQNVTGLTNGTSYTFTVAAINAIGTGSASAASNAVTPATVPDAPTGASAVGGNAQATVSWVAPVGTGGSAITGYVVTPYIGAVAQPAQTFNSTATTQPVTGLTNGTTYTFTVEAVNAVGNSTESAASNAVTPVAPTAPGAPTGATAIAGNTQATVSWTAPASDGGSAITGYVVTPYIGAVAQPAQTFNSTATSQNVTGLTNGTTYSFTVEAVNGIGTGAESAPSNTVTPNSVTAPGAPTIGAVVPGNGQISVTWAAPASNGGSAVTGYVVTPYIAAVAQTPTTFNSTGLSHNITGLTNGTSYTFTVAAKNAIGTGAPSAASAEVIAGTPLAPGFQSAAPGNNQAKVAWTTPGNNGSAITGYQVTPYVGAVAGTPQVFNSTATSEFATGLVNGTAYTFSVRAINGFGAGAASVTAPITVGAPGSPSFPNAAPGNTTAKVAWIGPSGNGAPITSYTITPVIGSTPQTPVVFNSTATSQIMTGLTNGTSYTFRLTATNSLGTSPVGTTAAIIVGAPAAPGFQYASPADSSAVVHYTLPAANASPITGYIVTPYVGSTAGTPQSFATPSAIQLTVTGLTNGTTYTFRIVAVNALGLGPVAATAPIIVGTPATPGFPGAVPGNGTARVAWSAGAANGSAITGYVITPVVGSTAQAPQSFASTATSQVLSGLVNGTTYTFRVAAVNAIGTGPYSTTTAIKVGTPTAPTFPSAVPGNASAKVSWGASTANGSAITGYVVTPVVGTTAKPSQTFLSTATTEVVTGLTNGTTYTFRVAAINGIGTGPYGTTAAIKVGVPLAPTAVGATAGSLSALVHWTAPADNGSAITSYIVTPYLGSVAQTPQTFVSSATSQNVVGLVAGSSYTFKVVAVNAVGSSAASSASTAVVILA